MSRLKFLLVAISFVLSACYPDHKGPLGSTSGRAADSGQTLSSGTPTGPGAGPGSGPTGAAAAPPVANTPPAPAHSK